MGIFNNVLLTIIMGLMVAFVFSDPELENLVLPLGIVCSMFLVWVLGVLSKSLGELTDSYKIIADRLHKLEMRINQKRKKKDTSKMPPWV